MENNKKQQGLMEEEIDRYPYMGIDNCGFGLCDCSEDNNCGCTFPNNLMNYNNCPVSDELCQVKNIKK